MHDDQVALVHAYADLEELRAKYASTLRDTIARLAELPVALSRPNPKVAVSAAVINEVVADLYKKLKEL